jgi:hypothetical protein
VCTKSLSLESLPSQLKHSVIKALDKKGDRNNMVYYRHISLLTSLSEVFKKDIHVRHLEILNDDDDDDDNNNNRNVLVYEQF